jgi:hypothetical protein
MKRIATTALLALLALSLFSLTSITWALPEGEEEVSLGEFSLEELSFEEGENSAEEDLAKDSYGNDLSSAKTAASVAEEESVDGLYQIAIGGETAGSGGLSTLASSNAPILNSAYSSVGPSAVVDWGGHTYAVYDVRAQWPVADSFSRLKGGHLVTITSAGEQAMVRQLLTGAGVDVAWIGLDYSQGYWRWVTGEVLGYNNFVPFPVDPPLDFRGVFYAVAGYAEGQDSSGGVIASWPVLAGGWTGWTADTWSPTAFVCEWEGSYIPPNAENTQARSVGEAYWADPVDLSAGAQTVDLSYLDMTISIPFSFDLSYRSDRLTPGEMGRGWRQHLPHQHL